MPVLCQPQPHREAESNVQASGTLGGRQRAPGAVLRAADNARKDARTLRHSVDVASRSRRASDAIVDSSLAVEAYPCDKSKHPSITRKALGRTWLEYHAKAVRTPQDLGHVPPFPITVRALEVIAPLMKMERFRSFNIFLSWTKASISS